MGDSKNIKQRDVSYGSELDKPKAAVHIEKVCQEGSMERSSNRSSLFFCLLIFFLLIFSPQTALPSGIGLRDYHGQITIRNSYFRNNLVGIQATTTNTAITNNNTIDNLLIDNNDFYDSLKHGMKFDLTYTGKITIQNNFLDNSYVPSTGPNTKNGRYGIRIKNHPSPLIDGNTIQNFGRSAIQLQSITNIFVINNLLYSNGSQEYSETYSDAQISEKRYFGMGLQAINSTFVNVSNNVITSNHVFGIGDNLSVGTIGPNNIIRYNGDPSLGTGGGGIEDCVIAAGGGGVTRGGVMVWNLPSAGDTVSICNNSIYDNYSLSVGHNGVGSVYSCSNKITPFFAKAEDAVFYFDEDTSPNDLDCLNPGLIYSDRVDENATIDAAGRSFGIIIEGSTSNVTVTNCTIKNAAMNDASRVRTGQGNYIGAGIFIVNNAEPSISNNYLFSNGWDVLDDRIYTEAGASGIQMRCSGADTKIFSNTFEANANDGLVARESGGLIGQSGKGNTFLNNGRGGIGIYDGTTHNLEIADNVMYSNQRGIGALDFDGTLLRISYNKIYSNQNSTSSTGGISIKDLSSAASVSITNNTLTNNSGWKSGGIGLLNGSLTTVDFNVFSNTVSNNAQSGIGIQGAQGFTIRNNLIYSNGAAEFSIGTEYYGSGIQLRDSSLTNEAIVDNTIHSNYFAGIAAYNVGGTIGQSGVSANDIRFNGDVNATGGLCAGVGGTGRGGVSARGLTEDLFVEDPSYIVTSNYTKTAQLRPGSTADFYYNGVKVNSTFWSDDDVQVNITGDITYDCDVLGTEIRGGNVWGITVLGNFAATIKNCSIYNNCTDSGVCDGDIGGGVLIAGGANVYMDNNTVFNNGYAAQPVGQGKSAGVVIRCAGDDTTLVNNTIENNLNDGLVAYDTNGYIGLNGAENIIRNNGRHGIGLRSFAGGESDGPVIAYNRIYSNTAFGIGSFSLTNMNATILNNTIYSNHVANTLGPGSSDLGGGIGMMELLSFAKIEGNTIRNNSGADTGGIGITASNATVSIIGNTIKNNTSSTTSNKGAAGIGISDTTMSGDWSINNNYIFSNTYGYMGGLGFNNIYSSGAVQVSIINNKILSNGWGESSASSTDGAMAGGVGNIGTAAAITWVVDSNTISNNNGWKSGGFGTKDGAGEVSFTNNTVENNKVYDACDTDQGCSNSYMGPGVGLSDSTTSLYVFNSYFAGNTSFSSGAGYVGGAVGIYWDLDYKTSTNGRIAYMSVINNKINYNGRGAITVSGAPQGATGPRFSLTNGILISDNIFSNASVSLLGMEGVYSATTGELTPLVISGNTFYNASTGSGMGGPSALSLNVIETFNNVVRDNLIEDTLGICDATGMFCTNCSSGLGINNNRGRGYLSIYNNSIINLCSSGIQIHAISGVAGSFSGENRIYNNYIYSVGEADLSYGNEIYGYGIQMNGTAGEGFTSIYNNEIYSGMKGGIGFSKTDSVVVWANTVRNNSRGGIGFSSTGNATDEIIIIGNKIYENINLTTNGVGGIGFNEHIGGTVSIVNNYISSNTGGIGGVGLTISNGAFSFINNEINNNVGSGLLASSMNVGGVGFNLPDNAASIYLSGNTLDNNKALVAGGPERGRVGALGVSHTNATVSLVNNTFSNNEAICIGGAGFDTYGGTAYVYSNVIKSNTNYKSEWGAGGLAFDEANGAITISANTIYNNINQATGSGGVGINYPLANASFVIEQNQLFSNVGQRASGIGITLSNTSDITIYANTIYNHSNSGLGIWEGSFFNIQNNLLYSNGLNGIQTGDEISAAGILLRNSTFTNSNISANTIRNNSFTGIEVYTTDGYIGPDNYIHDNGNAPPLDCVDGPGSGDGGIAVRGLGLSDTLIVSANLLVNNNVQSVSRKDCDGTVRLNGTDVGCGYWTRDDVVVFIESDGTVYLNGSLYSSNPVIDCNTDPGIASISNSTKAWGVAVKQGATGVTIRNCNIFSNNFDANIFGPENTNMGGGIFVGNNADVQIHSNNIYNNGCDSCDGGQPPPLDQGGSAGVVLRCADANTSIYNNYIYSNESDGIDIRDSSAIVGISGSPNYIYNNGRHGVGLKSSDGVTSDGPVIAYNLIYSNTVFGIGGWNLTDMNATIQNNTIYSNHVVNSQGPGGTDIGGGIGLIELSSLAKIENNTIRNNAGVDAGGIGVTASNGTVSIVNNQITGNSQSSSDGAGGIGLIDTGTSFVMYANGNTITNNSGSVAGGIGGTLGNADGITIANNEIGNHGSDSGIGFSNFTFSNALSIVNNDENGGIHNNNFGISLEYIVGNIYIGDSNIVSGSGTGGIRAHYNEGVTVDNNTVLDSLGDSWGGYGFANNTGRISIVNNGRIKGYGIAGQNNTGGFTFSNNEYIHYMDFQYNSCDFSITDNTLIDEIIGHDNNTGGSSTFLVDNNTTVGFGLFGAADDFSVTNNSLVNISTSGGMSGWAGYGGGLGAGAEFRVYVGNNSIINGNLWCQNSEIVEFVDNTTVNVNLHFDNIYSGGVVFVNNSVINGSFEGQNNDYVNLLGNTAINNTISIQNSTISIANNSLSGNFVSLLNSDQIDILYNVATAPIMIKAGSSSVGISIANNPLLQGLSLNNNGFSVIPEVSGNSFINASSAGISVTLGGVSIANNYIFSNAGGIGIDAGSGQITISGNLIYSNTSTGSQPGAIGLSDLVASASVLVENNTISNNIGWKIGSIGITNSNTTDVTIFSNYVYNNDESGIGIRDSDYVTIQNNLIVSNGSADTQITDEHFGFGVQLRDSIFAYNNIYSNIIRHNKFAGIGAYGVTGTIGPNNEVKYNGDQSNAVSCGVLTSGYGGLAARELGGTLRVYDYIGATWDEATNMIIDNYNKDTALRPGSTGSILYYNDEDIMNKWVSPSDAVYYFDGISQTTTYNLNCDDSVSNTIDATGYAYGVIIIGENADVEVQNCTITNAASTYADLQYKGSGDSMGGAGILVAANATANIHNNWVLDNGFQMNTGRMTKDNGDPATDDILNYFWYGGGGGDEFGRNDLWIRLDDNELFSGEQTTLYFYSGNPAVDATDIIEALTDTYFKINEKHTESGLVSYWNFDGSDLEDGGPYGYDGSNQRPPESENPFGINYYGNDYRFVNGWVWMNQRNGYGEPDMRSMRTRENFGEDNYVSAASGSSNLDITRDQTIAFWIAPDSIGPAYTRESSADGTGGVHLNFRTDGTLEFKIADLDDENVYTCVTPEGSYDTDSMAFATMITAVYDYNSIGSGKMKLYVTHKSAGLEDSPVASKDVPQGFEVGYDSDSISYLGAADLDGDGGIEVGETLEGTLDEVLVYNVTLTEKRIEALHYHREYDPSVETNGWPTVTLGLAEAGNYTLADETTWPTRWPITIDNVNATINNFQVGPVVLVSPDSGGIMMRCVDENVTVVDNEMNDNRRDGLSGYDMDGTRIGYNTIKNNARFGIGATSTINNVSVHNNYVSQNDRGIGGINIAHGDTHYSIVNNHLYDNDKTAMGWKRQGIALTASNNAKLYIGGNLIEYGVNGIGIQNMFGSSTEITVENNTIQNNTGAPFETESWEPGGHLLIKDNVMWGNTKPLKIRFMPGVYSDIDSNYFDGVWYDANIRRGNSSGLVCNDCGYATVQNNTFTNFGRTNKGNDTLAAIRFEFMGDNSGMVIDNNYLYNNKFNGIIFQDCSGVDESISITNNTITDTGCRRIQRDRNNKNGGCINTSTPDGDSNGRHGTIPNLAAIQFRDVDDMGYVYIADNTIDSNYIIGVRFMNNDNSNVTLHNNTITNNVAYFPGSTPVSESGSLQETETTLYNGTIGSVNTGVDGFGNSVDYVTLSNDPGLEEAYQYYGIHLLTDGTPADTVIYSYNTVDKIAWIHTDTAASTFTNKPSTSSSYTMEDPDFIYFDTSYITLANSASPTEDYYAGLMITISNFESGVDIAGSQPGPDNEITMGNNANGSTDNYYTSYHLIDAGADLEYNRIVSYDSSTKIAYMNRSYQTKPSGTSDVGYPIKYIDEYDATSKQIKVAGGYAHMPTLDEGYTIAGGVDGPSGYVDGTAMKFRNNTSGSLLIEDTYVAENWRGIWFQDIPDPIQMEGNVIVSNMGIGVRAQEVASVTIGRASHTPCIDWPDGGANECYNHMNGSSEDGLFNAGDEGNFGSQRDALTKDAMANGGNIIRNNGSWGVQMVGRNEHGYSTNVWFNGGEFRKNGAQAFGNSGAYCNMSVYNAFIGGNAGDAASVRGGGTLLVDNTVVRGSDAIQSSGGATFTLRNYALVNTLVRASGYAYIMDHSYVSCVKHCQIYDRSGWSSGNFYISDHVRIPTVRQAGGSMTFYDNVSVGVMAWTSGTINVWDSTTVGNTQKQGGGCNFLGYKYGNYSFHSPNLLSAFGNLKGGCNVQGNNILSYSVDSDAMFCLSCNNMPDDSCNTIPYGQHTPGDWNCE